MPPALRKAMPSSPKSASAARSGSARSGPNGPTSRRSRSSTALTTACREIETNIASSVARILLPFLADAVRDKAIGSLVEQIAALTSIRRCRCSGSPDPSELSISSGRNSDLAGRTGIEYEAADTVEVRVVADQTVIETQISAWMDRLKEARR